MIQKSQSERYIFLDALRGIACVAVLIDHLFMFSLMSGRLHHVFPAFLPRMASFGAYGVQIFFVLSGFVIAHSLRSTPLNSAAVGNFMLRRQLRLDPPYWTVLVLGLLLSVAKSFVPAIADPLPTPIAIVLNALYLNFLIPSLGGSDSIVGGAWTLCLEIQFYLVFILMLVAGKALAPRQQSGSIDSATLLLIFVTGALSLLIARFPIGYFWFYRYWFYFAAGVLGYWAVRGMIAQAWFVAFAVLFALSLIWSLIFGTIDGAGAWGVQQVTPLPLIVGLGTILLIWGIGRRGKLAQTGSNAVIQYLGRISYSLYLIHMLVIPPVLYVGHKVIGTSLPSALICIVIAAAVSIGAAHLLHILVERPSMRFASRMKLQKNARCATGVFVTA